VLLWAFSPRRPQRVLHVDCSGGGPPPWWWGLGGCLPLLRRGSVLRHGGVVPGREDGGRVAGFQRRQGVVLQIRLSLNWGGRGGGAIFRVEYVCLLIGVAVEVVPSLASSECNGGSMLRAKALVRFFLVEWRRRL
jgi:hypothetical protein